MTCTLKNELLTVEIDALGAQLCSVKNGAGIEYIWKADPAVWNRHAPLLFPVIGRLRDGRYTVHGETCHIGSHGFARDSVFTVAEVNDTRAVFTLTVLRGSETFEVEVALTALDDMEGYP